MDGLRSGFATLFGNDESSSVQEPYVEEEYTNWVPWEKSPELDERGR